MTFNILIRNNYCKILECTSASPVCRRVGEKKFKTEISKTIIKYLDKASNVTSNSTKEECLAEIVDLAAAYPNFEADIDSLANNNISDNSSIDYLAEIRSAAKRLGDTASLEDVELIIRGCYSYAIQQKLDINNSRDILRTEYGDYSNKLFLVRVVSGAVY